MQGNIEQAIENLQQAVSLSPDEYREKVKADSDFDSIRDSERFQALIQEESDWEEGEIDEGKWLTRAANNPVFDFLKDPEEDIYTLADSKPFNNHLSRAKLKEGETKIFHNFSWEEFENILAEMGDNRSSRVAYNQGTPEITMPSQKHEYYK